MPIAVRVASLAQNPDAGYSCRFAKIRQARCVVWDIIRAAGWPIWPLILSSIIALALIIERMWTLRQSEIAPRGLVDVVLTEYRKSGLTEELVARTAQSSPLGRVLASGLINVKSSRVVMKEAIEEVGGVVSHDLGRFLTTLGTIA